MRIMMVAFLRRVEDFVLGRFRTQCVGERSASLRVIRTFNPIQWLVGIAKRLDLKRRSIREQESECVLLRSYQFGTAFVSDACRNSSTWMVREKWHEMLCSPF